MSPLAFFAPNSGLSHYNDDFEILWNCKKFRKCVPKSFIHWGLWKFLGWSTCSFWWFLGTGNAKCPFQRAFQRPLVESMSKKPKSPMDKGFWWSKSAFLREKTAKLSPKSFIHWELWKFIGDKMMQKRMDHWAWHHRIRTDHMSSLPVAFGAARPAGVI